MPGLVRKFGLVCLLALVAVFAILSWLCLKNIEEQRRIEAREVAQAFALRLVERFGESLGAVFLLGGALDRQSGAVERFDETANDLLRDFPLVRALQFAPGGVIRYVSPLRGNEVIVGHDLLIDKTRNREVHLAISRRQLAVAGPFELRQGGLAIVARYPVFISGVGEPPRFWGLSIGVIDYPALMRAAGESEFERQGLVYQFCWVPRGEVGCKAPDGTLLSTPVNAERLEIGSSHADWRIAVYRPGGWLASGEVALAVVMVALMALLVAGLAILVAWRRLSSVDAKA